ncbi:hypothetical protein SAMN05216559_1170 [Halomicrobium zhouii]|uniref:Uncharacterized protein n=1 Tax=Halomicrobium zhouii TaxID=767519 RepID=A0A1I6KNQ3_9EURY|nr:hypothetical protein [Halomicrobium zhouii]SFR92873.1 hypothetical protein SAMN05216559_1170 [Halomicrobium zhouii]
MTDANTIDVLCDGDCATHAETMWNALARQAENTENIRMKEEEYSSPESWNRFRWNRFHRAKLRPFGPNRDSGAKPVPDLPHVEIRYDPQPFSDALAARDESALAASAVDLLELVEGAYSGGPSQPKFVYGVSEPHYSRLVENDVPPPVSPESLAADRIEYACWLMGFPPALVETYGRETLLSAPAWQTTELPDGGVVVLATENPTNVCKPETRAIDQHLGLDPPPETEECDY